MSVYGNRRINYVIRIEVLVEELEGKVSYFRSTGINLDGMPDIFAIFKNAEDRDEYRARFAYKWIETDDRTARLTYVMDWFDQNGYGLQLVAAPAWG
jgi:hypothetical protein